nr:MAG TPA: hypothetical protein [Caudoviricetes sp.]
MGANNFTHFTGKKSSFKTKKRKKKVKVKRVHKNKKDAIPNMSEFDKGYILGKTESFSENKPDDSDQKQRESS